MNTWNSHQASSCWCGVSLHLQLCDERLHLGAGTSHTLDTCVQSKITVHCQEVCAFVLSLCTVNISPAIRLLRQRNGCRDSWGIRRLFSPPPKRWVYTLPKAQTHSAPVPRRACICMQSCTHMHKELLHRLHHTFQVISSSASYFIPKQSP